MIQPMQTTATRDDDVANYQPMAILAVVAIIVSGLFMALAVVLTIVGMVTRRAVLEPWLVIFAVIGVLLAIAARWQIRLSEGTKAGLKLASAAWWLAIIGGCVYAAYYAGSVMSIQSQARTFVQDIWLKNLVDNKVDDAFLLTIEPIRRKGMNIRDIRARFGDIVTPFRTHGMVRMLKRSETKVSIEQMGVATWQATNEGLEVTTQFVIRTPEGDFDFLIPVLGTDHKELEGRQWQIKVQKVAFRPLGLSSYGRAMIALEQDSNEFLHMWVDAKLQPFRRGEMYMDTTLYPKALSREERLKLSHGFQIWTLVSNAFVSMGQPAGGLGIAGTFGGHLVAAPAYADPYFQNSGDVASKLIRWDESKQKQDGKGVKEKWLESILG